MCVWVSFNVPKTFFSWKGWNMWTSQFWIGKKLLKKKIHHELKVSAAPVVQNGGHDDLSESQDIQTWVFLKKSWWKHLMSHTYNTAVVSRSCLFYTFLIILETYSQYISKGTQNWKMLWKLSCLQQTHVLPSQKIYNVDMKNGFIPKLLIEFLT